MKPTFLLMLALWPLGSAPAQDWYLALEESLVNHKDLRQAQLDLQSAQEELDLYLRSRWGLPVSVVADTSSQTNPGLTGSVGLSFPLGETPDQGVKRRGLESSLALAQETWDQAKDTLVSQGISLYWSFRLSEQNLALEEKNLELKSRSLDRLKVLWEVGQASLSEVTEGEASLRQAQTSLIKAQKTLTLARAQWYTFLGRKDEGERWTEDPVLKPDLKAGMVRDFREGTAYLAAQVQNQKAQETAGASRIPDLPLTLKAGLQGPGAQSVGLTLSGSTAQGSLAYQFPSLSAPNASESWGWSLQLSFNPELLSWLGEDKTAALAGDKALTQWEETLETLEYQALEQKADWEAAVAALASAESAVARLEVLDKMVQIKVQAGQVLGLEGETSALELAKARWNRDESRKALFTAAAQAGQSPDQLLELKRNENETL